MAKRGPISLVEQHLEKGLLGLATLFMLFVAVRYLGMEPNKVEFGGERLGPAELDEAILRRAEDLQRAVRSVQPKSEPVPDYAAQLQRRFTGGLFAGAEGVPPLPDRLPVLAQFGPPLPKIEEGQEPKDIVVVTPLKPRDLVVETGISLLYRQDFRVIPTAVEESASPADEGPVERSWVTVAAYFPIEAQLRAMTEAGYAPYRAKVYIVGADVQRQEMGPNGEFGEWQDVQPSKAAPKLDLPTPVYDDKTGELVNQAELDQALTLVRTYQQYLMQPWFYPVEAGDEWQVPPLPGHQSKKLEEAEKEKEKEKEKDKSKPEEPKPPPRTPPPPPTGGGGRGMGPVGGGRGMAPGGGGGRGMTPPGGRGGFSPFGGPAAPPAGADASKQAVEDIKAARKALRDKDWALAEQKADAVINNSDASKTLKHQAERIKRDAADGRARQERQQTGTQRRGAVWQGPETVIKHPEREGEVAVWFHDDSVTPGKTYRYRMRVKLWNRYVGRRANLRDPAQADKTVLVGEWSLPSPPVTVAPKQHFFVRGPVFGENAVAVDVFSWHKGNWLKEEFKVQVGSVIGGRREVRAGEFDDKGNPTREWVDFSTGAVVLDVRLDEPVLLRRAAGKQGEFAYRDAKSLVLVYLDPADGQVKERVADLDRADPLYKRLRDEFEEFRSSL